MALPTTNIHSCARYRGCTPTSRTSLRRRGSGTVRWLPSMLRVGSWIGGDRDGNPYVTHEVTRHAMKRHATVALDFHLKQIHALGAELSMSRRLVSVSPEVEALAAGSPDKSDHREDEPYRKASPVFMLAWRLPPTIWCSSPLNRSRWETRDRMRTRRSSYGTWMPSTPLCAATVRAASPTGVCGTSAVRQRCSDFTSPPSTCASTRGCTRPWSSELLELGGNAAPYGELTEAQRLDWLQREIATPRPLRSPFIDVQRGHAEGARDLRRRCRDPPPLRGSRASQLHNLEDRRRKRHARGRVAA